MIGTILKLIRLAQELNEQEAATQLETGVLDLVAIENNYADISVESLIQIAELYDMPASQILCYHEFLTEEELTEEEIKESIKIYYLQKEDPELLEKGVSRLRS